jgi:carbon-monoxide dehydrogenase large subunit
VHRFLQPPAHRRVVKRKEDYRFLTGAGQYTDDINLANQTYACSCAAACACRASRASTPPAEAMPGVVKVFTGKDMEGKMGGLPCGWLITARTARR